MTDLESILKNRDITLPTMVGCETWAVKKAECRRIDAFEQWCWRRLLRVPWTAAYQASPSMGFSRQEYWSGVPLPCPVVYLKHSKSTIVQKKKSPLDVRIGL